jgi:hypothetical protein
MFRRYQLGYKILLGVTAAAFAFCFVLALCSVPWFPKVMVFVWGLDLFIQPLIAARRQRAGGLPPMVAMPLQTQLFGNIQKVLISVAVWLPYLILSDRVNITYRQRVRMPATI